MTLKQMALVGAIGYYIYSQSKKQAKPVIVPGVGTFNAATRTLTYINPVTGQQTSQVL